MIMRYFLPIQRICRAGVLVLIFSGCASTPLHTLPEWNVPMTEQVPVIDGSLDDLWAQAPLIEGLSTASDHPETPSALVTTPATEIRLLWDTNALYVFFTCWDDRIDYNETLERDDNLFKHDVCELFIDPVGDARQWMEIQVSPIGQVLDMVYHLPVEPEITKGGRLTERLVKQDLQGDRAWTADGMQVATGRVMHEGRTVAWTVEMSIPAETILAMRGMQSFEEISLRLNLVRYDWEEDASGQRTRNQLNWVPVLSGCPHISPTKMGILTLINQNR